MLQKFHIDTLMSKWIKGFLSKTDIPLFNYVKIKDYLIKDCIYIYDHYIIKCLTSGELLWEASGIVYPQNDLYPSYYLYPGNGSTQASFKVLGHVDLSESSPYTYRYFSPINYYDSTTHYHLGNYLRFLRDSTGLDLMRFYNCYNYEMLDNFHLKKNGIFCELVKGNLDGYKVIAIPIKFGKRYKIALECNTEVLMRCVLYNNSRGNIKRSALIDDYFSDDEQLERTSIIYPRLQFHSPISYQINVSKASLYNREKWLYLVIQIPTSCDSSIVAIESEFEEELTPNSLLFLNSKTSYAFSNRLIEYLLLNVVNPNDELNRNIEKTQSLLAKIDTIEEEPSRYIPLTEMKSNLESLTDHIEYLNTEINNIQISGGEPDEALILKHRHLLYEKQELEILCEESIPEAPAELYSSIYFKKAHSRGIWDDNLTKSISRVIKRYAEDYFLQDQDGYLNRDLEAIIFQSDKEVLK